MGHSHFGKWVFVFLLFKGLVLNLRIAFIILAWFTLERGKISLSRWCEPPKNIWNNVKRPHKRAWWQTGRHELPLNCVITWSDTWGDLIMHSCFIHRSHCWSFIYAHTKGNWNILMLCAVVLFLRKTFGIRSKRIHIAQGCCGMAFWGTTLNSLTSNMTWFVAEEQKSWRNSRRCGQNMCLLLRVISYRGSVFF